MKLTLSAGDMSVVKLWEDDFYEVHKDCQGHIRAIMYLRKGEEFSISTNRKIYSKSSIEGELIGVDNSLEKYYGQDTS